MPKARDCLAPGWGQRPEKCNRGPPEYEQRGGDQHENLVLRHVYPEQLLPKFVQWGIERNDQRNPTECKCEYFPNKQLSIGGPSEHSDFAQTVKGCREQQGNQDERWPCPVG